MVQLGWLGSWWDIPRDGWGRGGGLSPTMVGFGALGPPLCHDVQLLGLGLCEALRLVGLVGLPWFQLGSP